MNELDVVVLTRDLPDHGLRKGDVGTIVLVHENPEGYEVEFCNLTGETAAVVSLRTSDVRRGEPTEMMSSRARG